MACKRQTVVKAKEKNQEQGKRAFHFPDALSRPCGILLHRPIDGSDYCRNSHLRPMPWDTVQPAPVNCFRRLMEVILLSSLDFQNVVLLD